MTGPFGFFSLDFIWTSFCDKYMSGDLLSIFSMKITSHLDYWSRDGHVPNQVCGDFHFPFENRIGDPRSHVFHRSFRFKNTGYGFDKFGDHVRLHSTCYLTPRISLLLSKRGFSSVFNVSLQGRRLRS